MSERIKWEIVVPAVGDNGTQTERLRAGAGWVYRVRSPASAPAIVFVPMTASQVNEETLQRILESDGEGGGA